MFPLFDAEDIPRRRLLIKALAAGAFYVSSTRRAIAMDGILGKIPGPLSSGQSIYDLNGLMMVNGTAATEDTIIHAGDTLETGTDSRAIFAVGTDAFIMRGETKLELTGSDLDVQSIHVVQGALLSVFGKHELRLSTPHVSVGIRGTGVYVESMPDQAYVCSCYGVTQLSATGSPNGETETISATHHTPRFIDAVGDRRIRPAPFKNHTDLELTLIEALVGREPPFAAFDGSNLGGYQPY